MPEECREAGHGGDDKANHVFGKAVEGQRVSMGVIEVVRGTMIKLRT